MAVNEVWGSDEQLDNLREIKRLEQERNDELECDDFVLEVQNGHFIINLGRYDIQFSSEKLVNGIINALEKAKHKKEVNFIEYDGNGIQWGITSQRRFNSKHFDIMFQWENHYSGDCEYAEINPNEINKIINFIKKHRLWEDRSIRQGMRVVKMVDKKPTGKRQW